MKNSDLVLLGGYLHRVGVPSSSVLDPPPDSGQLVIDDHRLLVGRGDSFDEIDIDARKFDFTFTSPIYGPDGPTLAQVRAQPSYDEQEWTKDDSVLRMGWHPGIQEFSVPYAGVYRLVATGGAFRFCPAAVVSASVNLSAGQRLRILVGQSPTEFTSNGMFRNAQASSGATYVALVGSDGISMTPLLVAAGATSAFENHPESVSVIIPGQAQGGGAGGNVGNADYGGGGGWSTDGAPLPTGGRSFVNGGQGGRSVHNSSVFCGGFGGGAGGVSDTPKRQVAPGGPGWRGGDGFVYDSTGIPYKPGNVGSSFAAAFAENVTLGNTGVFDSYCHNGSLRMTRIG